MVMKDDLCKEQVFPWPRKLLWKWMSHQHNKLMKPTAARSLGGGGGRETGITPQGHVLTSQSVAHSWELSTVLLWLILAAPFETVLPFYPAQVFLTSLRGFPSSEPSLPCLLPPSTLTQRMLSCLWHISCPSLSLTLSCSSVFPHTLNTHTHTQSLSSINQCLCGLEWVGFTF